MLKVKPSFMFMTYVAHYLFSEFPFEFVFVHLQTMQLIAEKLLVTTQQSTSASDS